MLHTFSPTARHAHRTHSGNEQRFASLSESDRPTGAFQRREASGQSCKTRPAYLRPERESHIGAEPGVNPRSGAAKAEYGHFKEDCVIDLIDYDDQEVSFSRMGNAQFIQFVSEQGTAHPDVSKGSEGDLPPMLVRWINIGGIDWNVLSSLALRYNLDALALEDILHERGHNHSKADYYPNHLFLRILCHSLDSPGVQGEKFAPDHCDERSAAREACNNGYSAAEEGAGHSEDVFPNHSGTGSPSVSDLQLLTKTIPEVHFGSPRSAGSKDRDGSFVSSPPGEDLNGFADFKQSIRKRWSALSGYHSPARREQIACLMELKKDHRVDLRKEPLFIFLLHNGTVISIHPTPNLDYTAPIQKRLREADSVLRTSDDPSLLVESLLDLVVDRVLEVMDEYQVKISDLEHAILIEPSMNNVRSLHILSGDLIMHKRTLDPIKTMIFGLRKYDLDRCIALHNNLAMAKKEQQVREEKRENAKNRRKGKHQRAKATAAPTAASANVSESMQPSVPSSDDHFEQPYFKSDDQHLRAMAGNAPLYVRGWFSYKAKVYLADVYDHMDFALSSLDMFAAITENLINYAFNTASYEMNIVMSRLTLVTIIFLPLTLLTGYFGMNFQPFWSVDKNSDLFFWKIAIPIMATLIPLFMISDIKKMFRSYARRKQNRLAIQEFRNDPTRSLIAGS